MITTMAAFLSYFGGVRRRTLRFIQAIPADAADWAPREGEFTCADIVRHLAATEHMFVGVVTRSSWHYSGHQRSERPTLGEAIAYLHTVHEQATVALEQAGDAVLKQQRPTLDQQGSTMAASRVLLLMTEHEIHHRSQLASYLMLLNVTPPHLYGLGVEDLIDRAIG